MMIPPLEVSRGRSLSLSALEGESPSGRRPRLADLAVEPRACCRLVKLVLCRAALIRALLPVITPEPRGFPKMTDQGKSRGRDWTRRGDWAAGRKHVSSTIVHVVRTALCTIVLRTGSSHRKCLFNRPLFAERDASCPTGTLPRSKRTPRWRGPASCASPTTLFECFYWHPPITAAGDVEGPTSR
jgi:hypothetical protein